MGNPDFWHNIGSNLRHLADSLVYKDVYAGMNAKQALQHYLATEAGNAPKQLDREDMRAFLRGWRMGGVSVEIGAIQGLAHLMNAAELDELAADVRAVVDKWYARWYPQDVERAAGNG